MDTLKKTVVKTIITVQTPTDTEEIEIFGKVTPINIRQVVRLTTRARCKKDGGVSSFDKEILDNNFIILSQTTHSVMYECDIYDFLQIAEPIKTIS